MKKGFFKPSELQTKKAKQVGKNSYCAKCGLFKTCKSPKMPPTGSGKIPLLNLAEAPGAQEDALNEQLIGNAGQFHRDILFQFDIDLDDCTKDNACRCRPVNNKTPTKSQIKCCAPNIQNHIKKTKPKVILALGGPAIYSLLNHKFGEDPGGISKWQGYAIPDREYNAWLCPTFHPSYVKRETTPEVVKKFYTDDVERAVSLLKVPVPQFEKEENFVEIIKHPGKAMKYLKHLVQDNILLTAFDYETTGLKPHRKEQQIKTCAISEGPFHTTAFPFFKDLKFVQTFKEYLTNKTIKKICANIKFERDWSFIKLGVLIKGLFFDTMIGAHFINNKPGITSLEHNNYVNFGLEPYDTHIKKYLRGRKKGEIEGGNGINRIEEISLKDILVYNGLDSLTEFRNGLVQMDIIGIDYSQYYNGITGVELCPQYGKYKGSVYGKKESAEKRTGAKKKTRTRKRSK